MKTINAEKLQAVLQLIIEKCAPSTYSINLLNGFIGEAFPEAPVEKWRPRKGEKYWIVGERFVPIETTYDFPLVDEARFKSGNCFPTEQSCQEAIEKIKKALAE